MQDSENNFKAGKPAPPLLNQSLARGGFSDLERHQTVLVRALVRDFIFEMKGEFDWRQKGKAMYHWASPPKIEIEVFGSSLGDIAEGKLKTAIARIKKIEKIQTKYQKLILDLQISDVVRAVFMSILTAFYEEVFFIQPWIRYYIKLAEAAKVYTPPAVPKDRITEADIDRAKEYPLDQLITQRLQRAGRDFVCQCPFHEERTPSFHIYTKNNRYFCFGCGKYGDAITYVIEAEKIEFVEAVRRLQ